MRILAFSDLHMARNRAADLVAASAQADLVIGAGDFCNMRQGLDEAMGMLSGMAAPMLVVPGNAESVDELRDAVAGSVTVLHGESVEIDGLSFYGLGYGIPRTPFGDWSCDLSETQASDILDDCHAADIMILHSPPRGHVDRTSQGHSVGSTAILAAIERVQPKLAVCGHIHDSWGQRSQIGKTEVANLGPTVNWFEFAA